MNIEEFLVELNKIHIYPTKRQLKQLQDYYELLVEWNQKINLTRIIEKEEVYLKHFYDSATLNKIIDLEKVHNICDFGTGAGFPGVVIKILFPSVQVTLVDALNKRVNFLNIVIEKLKLNNIVAIHARIEDYARKNREKYDLVVARAVANLNTLLEYAVPLVKIKYHFVAMKANVDEELEGSLGAIKKLNIKLVKKDSFLLPKENSIRNLLVFQKEQETSKMYPRNSSKIKDNPL